MFSGRELVLVLLCVAVLLCIGSAQPQPKESAVKRLLSNDATTRKEAQQELVAARADVVSELVSIIDDKDNQLTRSDSVRAAMFVLGEMRATATVNGSEVTITNVECSNAFANHVKRYGLILGLEIEWYISRDGGCTWLDTTMTSENEVFITLDDPACATDYRTVLYLATKGSLATTESACITDTWANFSGPADVHAWDETSKLYLRDLHYYDGDTDIISAAGLLSTGDGQCGAWVELLHECLLANNVSGLDLIVVLPAVWHDYMAIKNIIYDDVDPTFSGEYAYYVNTRTDDLNVETPGEPGQNKATPYMKLFWLHYIVLYGATYFDPSYGLTYGDEADFTSQCIDGWRRTDYRWRKRDVVGRPSYEVRFVVGSW